MLSEFVKEEETKKIIKESKPNRDKDLVMLIDDFISCGLLSKRTKQLPIELKFKKIINYLLDYESQPEKMILLKKHKKLLWKILLHQTKFDEGQYPKLWLLASGAANSMDM